MQYRTGVVSVSNGSTTVTSDGTTAFLGNIASGDLFTLSTLGTSNPVYEIATVVDDSHFTLTVSYAESSLTNQHYVIVRDFTPNLGLPLIEKGAIETSSIVAQALRMLDASVPFDTVLTSLTTGQVLEYNGTHWVNKFLDTLGTITSGVWHGTTIAVGYGGTGVTSAPTNGQLLIGNGSGYTQATLAAGTGIAVTNNAGSITIGNTGVTSLTAGTGTSVSGSTGSVTVGNTGVVSIAGTTHQVIASASTGSVTLSLPQSIDTTSSPTFASVTISNAPSASTDATNKAYVDAVAQGLEVKQAVRVSPTSSTNITIANPGTAVFDGVTLSSGDRILLRGQTTTSQNGIWVFNGSASAMTRPTDFNGSIDGTTVTNWAGSTVFVSEGTAFGNCFYVLTTNNPVTIDTTGQAWTQYGGPGTYTAGTGLALTGGAFSISATYLGQTSLTTLGTITAGTWQGTPIDLTAHVSGVLPPANGGTGVNNGSSTITLAGNLTTSGANALTLTTTGATNVTLPTSGTLVNSAVATLSSLTSVGTISTGVWNATKIGTNKGGTNLTGYTTGDVLYASATNVLSSLGIGSSGQLLAVVSGVPAWANPSGSAVLASPTQTIGLTVKNGSATSVMRSDAAQALDVSIVPMWTGAHTFNAGATVTTASGLALKVNGIARTGYAANMWIATPNTTDQSNGLSITAGTSINDACLVLSNAANTYNYFAMLGDSSWSFTRDATHPTLTGSAAGNINIYAPSSGTALTVTGVSANPELILTSANGPSTGSSDLRINRAGSTANTPEYGPNVLFYDSTNTKGSLIQHSGGQTELWQYDGTSWIQPWKVTGGGNLNLNYGLTYQNNVWNNSLDGVNRLYFGGGGDSYIGMAAASSVHVQNSSGTNVLTCDSSGNLSINGAYSGSPYGLNFTLPDTAGTAQYIHLGTWTTWQGGNKLRLDITISTGYNASNAQNAEYSVYFKTANGSSSQSGSAGAFYGDGEFWARGASAPSAISSVLVVQNSGTSYDFYANCAVFTGTSIYTVTGVNGGSWANASALVGATTPSGNYIALPGYTSFDSTTMLQRQNTSGYLEGNYSGGGVGTVESGTTAGCIYTIGTASYRPGTGTTNALGTMYGCGYSTSNTTMGNGTTIAAHTGAPAGQWGMYVASGGISSIFLDSDAGTVYASNALAVGNQINIGASTLTISGSSYGRTFVVGGSAPGGYYGLMLNDGGLSPSFMSNGTTCGVYFNSSRWSFYDNGTFTTNQGISAPSYGISSDARLKDNVETITDALDKVTQLRGVTFTWNDKSSQKGKSGIGLIAQEVEQVLPELIGEFQVAKAGTPDLGETYKNVQYGNLVALLIEAVKDLKTRNDELSDRLYALESM